MNEGRRPDPAGSGSGGTTPEEKQHRASGAVPPSPEQTGRSEQPRVVDKRGSQHAEASAPVDPEAQLAAARRESAEHLDDLKRLKAEFENYRKRVLREQTSLVERLNSSSKGCCQCSTTSSWR